MLKNNFKIGSVLNNNFDYTFKPSNTYLFFKGDVKTLKSHCKSIFRGRMVRIEKVDVLKKNHDEKFIPYYSEIQIDCDQNQFLKDFNIAVYQLKTSIEKIGRISIISDDYNKVKFLSESIYETGIINGCISSEKDLRNLKPFFNDANNNGWIIFV